MEPFRQMRCQITIDNVRATAQVSASSGHRHHVIRLSCDVTNSRFPHNYGVAQVDLRRYLRQPSNRARLIARYECPIAMNKNPDKPSTMLPPNCRPHRLRRNAHENSAHSSAKTQRMQAETAAAANSAEFTCADNARCRTRNSATTKCPQRPSSPRSTFCAPVQRRETIIDGMARLNRGAGRNHRATNTGIRHNDLAAAAFDPEPW